jgi:hypothetical protein
LSFLADFEDEMYADKLDETLLNNEKEIKRYMNNKNESINEDLIRLLK